MGEAPDYNSYTNVDGLRPDGESTKVVASVPKDECTSPEQHDAALADTQQLIEAGERMAEVVKGMNGLLEAIRGIAEDASNETKPIPHNDVAEILHALCDTLLVPVITFAETGKNG